MFVGYKLLILLELKKKLKSFRRVVFVVDGIKCPTNDTKTDINHIFIRYLSK